jgi:hypothetical protein
MNPNFDSHRTGPPRLSPPFKLPRVVQKGWPLARRANDFGSGPSDLSVRVPVFRVRFSSVPFLQLPLLTWPNCRVVTSRIGVEIRRNFSRFFVLKNNRSASAGCRPWHLDPYQENQFEIPPLPDLSGPMGMDNGVIPRSG